MTRWTADPESAALALVTGALDDIILGDTVLLAGGVPALVRAVEMANRRAVNWNRRVAPGAMIQPEPPSQTYTSALLRLPKSRDEQLMTAHQCLGALTLAGKLYVYGGNDEGIRSFHKTLDALGPIATVAARGHGRILQLNRQDVAANIASRLADWRLAIGSNPPWTSYPGLFAGGAPDAGTALLCSHLPKNLGTAHVLDFGCGPGAISAAIRAANPVVTLSLLDNDSTALVAAAENVPGATQVLGDSLAATSARFDLIISNPPLHVGFKEDLSALNGLIATAPDYLAPGGALILVVQHRIALDRALQDAFATVDTLADNGRYRVWRASGKPAAVTRPHPPARRPR